MNRQTYSQRILSFLMKNEGKNPNTTFNKKVATRTFRNVSNIDGTIMRRARELASNKMLRRVSPGEYTLTEKGRKAVR